MKREAVGNTKMKRLCRRLNIPLFQAMGILEAVWHITARQAPQGDIGKLSDEDIADWMEWPGDPRELIEALVESKWIDVSDHYRLLVHDWHDHADEAVKKRLQRAQRPFLSGRVENSSGHVSTAASHLESTAAYQSQSQSQDQSQGSGLTEIAKRIIEQHPKYQHDLGIPGVEKKLRGIGAHVKISSALKLLAMSEEIADRHMRWCCSEQWRKNNGEFAKSLRNWLAPTEERYLTEPPDDSGRQAAEPQVASWDDIPKSLKAGAAMYEGDLRQEKRDWQQRMEREKQVAGSKL